MGFDMPRPPAPLRWGFAKVARKSGAFANSIAFVTARGQGRSGQRPCSARAGSRPHALAATASRLQLPRRHGGAVARGDRRPTSSRILPGPDAYQTRMHTATILRAVREMRAPMTAITVELNGAKVADDVEPRQTLADFLRDRCGLTATHLGCEHGACGACTVVMDGKATRSCLTLAVMCDGRSVADAGRAAQPTR